MSAVDKAELQRIAQQVELNRKRMESIEQQTARLEQIRLEQLQTIETLSAIPDEGAKGAMIPLGSGVQIITDIPPETGAVIDIGSRVQAEKTLAEAITILTKRTEEILDIMNKMKHRNFNCTSFSTGNLVDGLPIGCSTPQMKKLQLYELLIRTCVVTDKLSKKNK